MMLFVTIAFGQLNVILYGKGSYNSFHMNDLKNLQSELLNEITSNGIPAVKTETYPSYVGTVIGLLLPIYEKENNTIFAGVLGEYTSTGGRIHYQDFSGEIRADQVVSAFSLGGTIDYEKYYTEQFDVDFQLSAKLIFSSMKNDFLLQVGDAKQFQQFEFHSTSFGFEPAIIPNIKVSPIQLGISISYLLNLPTYLEYDLFSNAFLINNKGERVTINWSGFRFGFLVGVVF